MTTMMQAATMSTQASQVHGLVSQGKMTETLIAMKRLADLYAELASELAIEASRQGMTQKRIAELLDIPPSAVRGLKAAAAV